jgi:ParB family chromosome partitioning protein
MKQQQELNETKRTDLYKVDPRNIKVEQGFNIRKIDPNSDDIRKLMDSIKENGLRQPLLLRSNPNAVADGMAYCLIDGERRLTAIRNLIKAGEEIQYVNARVAKINNEEALLSIFLLNDGEPLTPVAKSEGVRRLVEVYQYKPSEVAKKIGESPSTVSNLIKLAGMPHSVKNKIEENIISSTLALEVIRKYPNEQEFIQKINELTELVEEDKIDRLSRDNQIALNYQDEVWEGVQDEADTEKKPVPKKKQAKVTAKRAKKVLGETDPLELAEMVATELVKEYDGKVILFYVKLINILKKKGSSKLDIEALVRSACSEEK